MTDGSDTHKPKAGETERPTVIDLEAEEIRHEDPTPPPPPSSPPKPTRPTHWRLYGGIAACVAAAIFGAWLYRDYGAAWWPSSQMQTLEARVAALESSAKTVSEQAAGLASELDRLSKSLADATAAAAGTDKTAEQAKSAVANLLSRLEKTEGSVAALRGAIDDLNKSFAQGGSTTTTAPPPDAARLTALEARVADLEKTIAALKAGPGADTQSATLLSQSLADLKAKLASGVPYKEEFDRIATLVPAAPGLDVLANHAETGTPNAAALAEELGRIAASLPGPEAPPPEGEKSYWDSFTDMLGSLVIIRRIGEADWRAAAGKAQSMTAGGDLKKAIDTLEGTEGERPAAISDWLNRARARLKVDAAAEDVAAAVLRQIAAIGGSP